jgi:hypothetical protein
MAERGIFPRCHLTLNNNPDQQKNKKTEDEKSHYQVVFTGACTRVHGRIC